MGRDVIGRYLERYATLPAGPHYDTDRRYDSVVVVPAFAEDADFLHRFAATDFGQAVLMVAVINAPHDADTAAWQRTAQLWRAGQALLAGARGDATAGPFAGSRNGLLMIDRFSTGKTLAPRQGVGHARRIGMDLALALIHAGRVRARAIVSSDADATLPAHLFDATPEAGDSAVCFGFRHTGRGELAAAQDLYDLRLRYYRAQLAGCGSPYAFVALGSALAVDAAAYAAVRGVPKRAAGEDFHLLNKLAKVGTIRGREDIVVRIRTRRSTRVPFGTGPGVDKLQASGDPREVAWLYHPGSFVRLRAFFDCANELLASGALDAARALTALRTRCAPVFATAPVAAALVRSHGASSAIAVRVRHFHVWFDGLRTLRAIHALRDGGLPNLSLRQFEKNHAQVLRALARGREVDWLTGIDALRSR